MHRRLDPVTGLMVLDGESVPSQVRNSITADIAEVNNKIQVFYPLGAAGTVPTSTGSGGVTWEPKNQFGINISFDNGSFDYEIDASLQTADRTATLPDRDGTFAFSANSVSGIDFGSISGNPSAVQNGQAWYDTAVNQFKFRQNASTIALSTMAGQDASNVTITGGSISGLSSLGVVGGVTFSATTAGSVSTSADITVNSLRLGRGAGNSNTSVAFGLNAGNSLSGANAASQEVAVGNRALATAHNAAANCAVGSNSLENLSGGTSTGNTAVGTSSGMNLTTGTPNARDNVIIGNSAGRYHGVGTTNNLTVAAYSIFIGSSARPAANSQTNQIVIGGQNALGDGSNTTSIGIPTTSQARIYGDTFLSTGANGQSTQLGQNAVELTALSGATRTATALIPANSIIIGVTARVTTAITGATSFDIGDGTTANLFGDDVAVALGTTSQNTIAPTRYATATNVVLTANGGNFTAGAVRLTVHFLTLVAPTS